MEYGTYEKRIATAIVDEMIARGVTSGGGGGGGSGGGSGGGDASAANQVAQITLSALIRDNLADIKTYTDSLENRLPSTLGAKAATDSLAVTLSNDGIFTSLFGTSIDNAAASDTANSSFIGLFKFFLTRITAIIGLLPTALSNGRFKVESSQLVSTTGTSAQVNASTATGASSAILFAANSNRKGGVVYNDSSAILFLKLGSNSSLTSYTVKLTQNAYYEIPGNYTGIVTGTWVAPNGFASCTELT